MNQELAFSRISRKDLTKILLRFIPWLFYCLLMIILAKDTFPALLFPVYFVVLLLLLTVINRTLGLMWVVATFLLGASIVPIISGLLTWPFALALGTDSDMFSSFIVPVVEETIKIVPVLLLLILPRKPYRWTFSATDLLVLGAAVGAGFAFHEETLRGFLRYFTPEMILDMHYGTPHVGPVYFFPNMDVQIGTRGGLPASAFIGHGGAAAFIMLAVGLTRLLPVYFKRLRDGDKLLWIIPVFVWGWMIFDHALFNFASYASKLPILLRILYTLDGFGYTSSVVLYLLILLVIILEQLLLRKGRSAVQHLKLAAAKLRLLKSALKSPLEIPFHLIAVVISALWQRGLIYGGYGQQSLSLERKEQLDEIAHRLALLKKVLELPEQGAISEPAAAE